MGPAERKRRPAGVVQKDKDVDAALPTPGVKPRLLRALTSGLRASYDYLGTVLVASLIWMGAATLLGAGGSTLTALVLDGHRPVAAYFALLSGIVAAGIGTGPLTLLLFYHARRLSLHDEPAWRELTAALARLWPRGLWLAALQMGASVVMFVDGAFFLSQRASLLRYCGVAFVYPLLFWWGSCLLQWPLAVERPEDSLWLVIKKSFLLFLDNLSYVCLFGSIVLLLAVFTLKTRVGMFAVSLAGVGTVAFLQTAMLRELLPKYAVAAQAELPSSVDN